MIFAMTTCIPSAPMGWWLWCSTPRLLEPGLTDHTETRLCGHNLVVHLTICNRHGKDIKVWTRVSARQVEGCEGRSFRVV